MDEKAQETIQARQATQKKALIDELKKMPIIEVACRRTDTGRTTYYRWREEDKEFAKEVDESIQFGKNIINDLAESKVITGIKDDDKTYTLYWLNHNHTSYQRKVEAIQQKTNGEKLGVTDAEIRELFKLFYNPDTYQQGQELLATYVLKGKVSETNAQFILKLFLTQMKVKEVESQKKETEIMDEILFRKQVNIVKK